MRTSVCTPCTVLEIKSGDDQVVWLTGILQLKTTQLISSISGLLYTSPYDYPTYTTLTSPILEYPAAVDISGAGTLWKR